jgi:putative hydrolase of the HAD superfamily
MVIVFDLDDTLYDEMTFVHSGLLAVSKYLEKYFMIPVVASQDFLKKRIIYGREGILDDILRHFNLYNKKNVRKCLSTYRGHKPEIQIYPDAELCLNNLSRYPKYIVTDGNKLVQHNKVLALDLYNKVDFVFITHRYGLKHAKPSPYCFYKICKRERVSPDQVVYIADNPNKDFVGIKPLGFKTIRVLQGPYKDLKKTPEFEADYNIRSLAELDVELLHVL